MLGRFAKTADGQRELMAAAKVEEQVLKIGMRAVLAEVTEGRIEDEDEAIRLVSVASAFVERVKYEAAVAERWLTKNGHELTDEADETADGGDADAGETAGDNPPPADEVEEKAATTSRRKKPAAK